MKLHVVGSADAFNSFGRGHSCYWIEGAGKGPIMIDFGATALARLDQEKLHPPAMHALVITHLHGDHFGGLPFLIIDGLYNRFRDRPLDLVGPIGFKAKLEALLEVTYGAAAKLSSFPHTLREMSPGEEIEVAGARVRAFAAAHMDPPDQPLCIRVIGRDGRSIAFSGDTELCDGLFAAADGADLLVAECTTLAPPSGRHITWEAWMGAFDRVRAKRLMLTHLGADVRARVNELLRQAPRSLKLSFADDGLIVEL